MERMKISFLCLVTLCLLHTNAISIKKSIESKDVFLNQNKNAQNETKEEGEVLEESSSDSIKFKLPMIFKGENVSIGETTKHKDLIKEENHFSSVISEPYPQRPWRVVEKSPPFRGQIRYSQPLTVTGPQAFVSHTAEVDNISPVEMRYTPTESSEEKSTYGPRKRDYSRESDDQTSLEDRPPTGKKYMTYTETNNDLGKFLPEEYRSKIEKEAEEMVKAHKASNNKRPTPQDEGNRPRIYKQHEKRGNLPSVPYQYDYHQNKKAIPSQHDHQQKPPTSYHNGYQQNQGSGRKTFFFLGKQTHTSPNPPKDWSRPYSDSYRVSSEENTDMKHVPQYTHNRGNAQPPTSIRHYAPTTVPFSSTETYPSEAYHTDKSNCPHRNPAGSVRQKPTESPMYQIRPRKYQAFENTPRHYSTTEVHKNVHSDYEQPYPVSYSSPDDYRPIEHLVEKKHENLAKSEHHNPPSELATYPPTTAKPYTFNPIPPVSQPYLIGHYYPKTYTGSEEEFSQEKFYDSYQSLLDLYRSYGFNPLEPKQVKDIFDPRFQVGSPFRAKIPISSMSTDHPVRSFRDPEYVEHIDSKPTDNYEKSSPALPGESMYSEQKGQRDFFPPSKNNAHIQHPKEIYHLEKVSFDSSRSPSVSKEFHESEMSRPVMFDPPLESPKDSYSQPHYPLYLNTPPKSTDDPLGRIRTLPIEIKDVNTDFYETPPEINKNKTLTLETPGNIPHSIVRDNPYQITSNSDESRNGRYKERPRVYGSQSLTNSNEQNRYKSNIIDAPKDALSSDSSNFHDANNFKPEKMVNPEAEIKKETFIEKKAKTQVRRKKSNKKGRLRRTKIKNVHDNLKQEVNQRSNFDENPKKFSKKNGKRSQPQSPKKHKHKRSNDQLQESASSQDWGIEKYKGIDGFFQYANVPSSKAFEYGYRMGDTNHTEEQHHHTKGTQSKIKVNWKNKNGDSGNHYWEFNHNSKKNSE